jgi:hypothetical protein
MEIWSIQTIHGVSLSVRLASIKVSTVSGIEFVSRSLSLRSWRKSAFISKPVWTHRTATLPTNSKRNEDNMMLKRVLIVSALVLMGSQLATASDRDDDAARSQKAAQVFKAIMDTPDSTIPQDLLEKAKCIAIIPGDKKFAFIFGGSYGRGLATCRTEHGWSAPMFLALDGGSVGYQIGGSSTDVVMLFMNEHALHSLLSDKFKLGADASVAAGPVGRNAAAALRI